ncbi:MAG: DNA-binding protein [Planctomycetaceae bacterium]|nr:DNA-binding protein [Planctomycetaceae bacterium]
MTKKKKSAATISPLEIEKAIHIVRGQRVMLDSDLAKQYGVTTAALNQAVKRNADRFPDDFAFQLSQQEFTALISQNVISKGGRGGRTKTPWVFTEHGIAMLSSVLRSPTAARVNIEIMRTFVRLRRLMATPGEFVEQLTRLAETVQLHDDQIKTITQVLHQMLEEPERPKRHIGFGREQDN